MFIPSSCWKSRSFLNSCERSQVGSYNVHGVRCRCRRTASDVFVRSVPVLVRGCLVRLCGFLGNASRSGQSWQFKHCLSSDNVDCNGPSELPKNSIEKAPLCSIFFSVLTMQYVVTVSF